MSHFTLSPGETEQQLIAMSQTHNLANFDFSLVPSLDRERTLQLFDDEFVNQGQNAMLFGGPGVGKTHLLYALAGVAAKRGKTVRVLHGESMKPMDGGDEMRPQRDIIKLAEGRLPPEERDAKVRLDLVHCDLLLVEGLPRLRGSDTDLTGDLLTQRFEAGRSTFIVSCLSPRNWLERQLLGEDSFVKLVKLQMGFFVDHTDIHYAAILDRITYPRDKKLTQMYQALEIVPLNIIHPSLREGWFEMPESELLRPWEILHITDGSLRYDPRLQARRG